MAISVCVRVCVLVRVYLCLCGRACVFAILLRYLLCACVSVSVCARVCMRICVPSLSVHGFIAPSIYCVHACLSLCVYTRTQGQNLLQRLRVSKLVLH